MSKKYIIYENCYEIAVYLVFAMSEEKAWARYIEEVRGYVQQSDGTYRCKEETYENLADALIGPNYDLILSENGEVIERSGISYSTLQEAFQAYNISPQPDGTYISYGAIYLDTAEALKKLFPSFCRHDIQEFIFDEADPCQLIFLSKDNNKYLENPSISVIAFEHDRQATRYESKGDIRGAIDELEKILFLPAEHQSQLSACLRIAHLYEIMGKWKAAELWCKKAWDMSIPHDDQASIAGRLGYILEKQSDFPAALRSYQLSVDLDLQYVGLDDLDIQRRLNHIEKIKAYC